MPKDTLFIIGNGFDCWQGLDTSYGSFKKYYFKHRDEILKKLKIKKKVIHFKDGRTTKLSDVEIVYGDPFDPKELDDIFWGAFEVSLSKINAERLNLFFGKDKAGLKEMNRSIRNAKRILREAFCSWISGINIDARAPRHLFGDNCLFINFNYTDTLLKHFGVKEQNEYHIHGEASDKESIVFGHSAHPQLPEEYLHRFGGRFKGLYYVENLLYETDKHVDENIYTLALFLAVNGANPECIKNIYVLGHSMSPADIGYFDFLMRATKISGNDEETSQEYEGTKENDPLDELQLRLQYAIEHTGYGKDDDTIDKEQQEAVMRRYVAEQNAFDKEFEKNFVKLFGKNAEHAVNSYKGPAPRTKDAAWHITYHTDKDLTWAKTVMTELGCQNYKLYPDIDECLKPFIKSE